MRMGEMCACCRCRVPEGMMACPEFCRAEPVTKEKRKEALGDILRNNHRGAENAVFSRILEEYFGIGGRDVRRIISELRKEGAPICSDYHRGYYYAENEEDINEAVKGLREHAQGVNSTVRSLRASKVVQPDEEIIIRLVIKPGNDGRRAEPVIGEGERR